MSDNDSWASAPTESATTSTEAPQSAPWDDDKPAETKEEPAVSKGIRESAEPKEKEEPENEKTEEAKEKSEKPAAEKPKETPKEPETKEETVLKVGDKILTKAEIEKLLEQASSVEQKVAEAIQRSTQAQQFLDLLQNSPEQLLNQPQFAAQKKKLIEDAIRQEIENELLTPDQRKIKEYEAREAALLKRQKEAEEAAKQQEFEARRQQKQQEYAEILTKAMEGSVLSSDPELSPDILSEMGGLLRNAKQNGYNPTPAQIAQHIEGKYLKAFVAVSRRLSGKQLVDFLGDHVVKEIRKHDIEALKPSRTAKADPPPQTWQNQESSKPAQKKIMDPHTAREEVRRKLGL